MVDSIQRRVRIMNLGYIPGPPESIQVNFVTTDTPQQYGGSFVISKQELKSLNVTTGDDVFLTIAIK